MLENRVWGCCGSEEKVNTSAGEKVCVCVCDRCFMVAEFVLLRGGVSKWPAAGYRPAGCGSGSLVFHRKTHCWYFSPYLPEGHMDQITRKHGRIL